MHKEFVWPLPAEIQHLIYGRDLPEVPNPAFVELSRRLGAEEKGQRWGPEVAYWDPPQNERGPDFVGSETQGQERERFNSPSSGNYKRSFRLEKNCEGHLKQFPVSRLVFFTITFAEDQAGPEHLVCPVPAFRREEWASAVRKRQRAIWKRASAVMRGLMNSPAGGMWYRLGDLVHSYVRVAEWRVDEGTGLLKRNSLHFHFILVMHEEVGEGFNHALYSEYLRARQKKNWPLVNSLQTQMGWHPVMIEFQRRMKGARAALARSEKPFKIGIFEARPCYGDNAFGVAWYLSSYLGKAARPEGAKGLRILTFSRNWDQACRGNFVRMSGASGVWRRQAQKFGEITGLKPDDVGAYFGRHGFFWLSRIISSMNVFHEAEAEEDFLGLSLPVLKAVRRQPRRQAFVMLVPPLPPEGCDWPFRKRDLEAWAWNLDLLVRTLTSIWDSPYGEKCPPLEFIPPNERCPF